MILFFDHPLNGMKFTSYDQDNDQHQNNCAPLVVDGGIKIVVTYSKDHTTIYLNGQWYVTYIIYTDED